ncbi:MAG: putative acetyltransferase protein [Gammaproteobacteria bacterium]|nr:putative acetyltransferase protein [Gammaproteobacteria bacterium]
MRPRTPCSQTTTVCDALRADLPEILAIYNEVIRHSTAVYSEEEFTPLRGAGWFDAKVEQGFPFLVARDASGVVGFGTFGDFRAWPCYRHTVEHSVHVRADARGHGIGRALMLELIARARAMQKHVMIAGIDADNAVSIGLHESLGFRRAGHFHEVGFKFGRWLDLVFLELAL